MTHYIPVNKKHEKEIFDALEIQSFEDLVAIIPKHLRIKDSLLGLEAGISEYELDLYIKSLSNSKTSNNNLLCFLFLFLRYLLNFFQCLIFLVL